VGASHSATSAIESELKYVSPDAHCIERRLVTAGGKRIKMRLLGTVVTSRYYVYIETTASLHVQRTLNQHELFQSVKTPKRCIHLCHSSPATQRREPRPATHLLPAESSVLPSACSGIWLRTNGTFQGPHFLIGCNVRRPQAAGPPAYPTSKDSCVVLRGRALTSH
jgi:hypothetical protein